MRNEFVRDLGIESKDYEKKLHIAFVEQNSFVLNQYQFSEVLYWSNKIIKANSINKVYSSTYFKEQLYLRLIRIIKCKKKRSLLDLVQLRRSAEFYDKRISFRDLLSSDVKIVTPINFVFPETFFAAFKALRPELM